uniref:Uncharacterized protein LOC104235884 n=1 Tax=Nicotiana sylvestris TaxID=4096 RepID=A0A1U7XNE7_NICSY|nr:PREDICTED: uncharacterized protein LOC104235884 [Nicotiana sylvestris]
MEFPHRLWREPRDPTMLTSQKDTLNNVRIRNYSELGGEYRVFWGQICRYKANREEPDEKQQEKVKKNWATAHIDRGERRRKTECLETTVVVPCRDHDRSGRSQEV